MKHNSPKKVKQPDCQQLDENRCFLSLFRVQYYKHFLNWQNFSLFFAAFFEKFSGLPRNPAKQACIFL